MDRPRSGTASGSLSHYGVKGMKWGVRRSDAELARGSSSSAEQAPRPEPKLSADVKSAMSAQRKIAEGGTQTLSNQELQGLLTRMNLERQYRSMTTAPPGSPTRSNMDKGHDTVKKMLAYGDTIEKVRKFLDTPTGKAVKTGVGTAVSAGAAYATGGTSAAVAAGAGALARNINRERNQQP
ncbi:hypothetical protein SEA_MADAMATO_7 [Streptomyces phage Madamato]|nr:hypothetical protein SEA_MADAMATO_7 [Streptomyces phage Madamato]